MRDMEPITLADFDAAPFRDHQQARLPGTPDALFALLADPVHWVEWFPLMRRAAWTSARTGAVGAEREVKLRVFGEFRERIIAWDPGARFSFTMLASSSPLVTRMGEDWRITREDDGVRLDWTVAGWPTTIGRIAVPGLRLVLRRLFRGGGANLRRLLGERGTQVA